MDESEALVVVGDLVCFQGDFLPRRPGSVQRPSGDGEEGNAVLLRKSAHDCNWKLALLYREGL